MKCSACIQSLWDEFGLTPLHYACTTDDPSIVEWLFSTVNSGAEGESSPDLSSRASLSEQWHLIQLFLENGTAECSFTPNLKILVIGNASAGKSTLIKAVQDQLNGPGKKIARFKRVSRVKSSTGGVMTTIIQTEHLGCITFYDFSGEHEYYSSHAVTLKSVISSMDSLIVYVIDLSQDVDKVSSTLNYWSKFISSLTAELKTKPCQQIVFSHSDVLSSSSALQVNQLKKLSHNVEMIDSSIAINCTKVASNGLTSVCDLIMSKGSNLKSALNQHKNRSVLSASSYLLSKFCANKASFPLIILLDRFNHVPPSLINHLLHALNKQGKIIFLENMDTMASRVILDVEAIITEVNGTIFSPNFHGMSSSSGMVSLSAICSTFKSHDESMIVDYLCHSLFCHKIASIEANLINGWQGKDASNNISDELLYFFPALVRTDRSDVHFFSPQEGSRFGWFLKCSEVGDIRYFRGFSMFLFFDWHSPLHWYHQMLTTLPVQWWCGGSVMCGSVESAGRIGRVKWLSMW